MSTGNSKGAERYAALFGRKATEDDHKFFALRESGYTGWIDQNNEKAPCPLCKSMSCTAGLTETCNG